MISFITYRTDVLLYQLLESSKTTAGNIVKLKTSASDHIHSKINLNTTALAMMIKSDFFLIFLMDLWNFKGNKIQSGDANISFLDGDVRLRLLAYALRRIFFQKC